MTYSLLRKSFYLLCAVIALFVTVQSVTYAAWQTVQGYQADTIRGGANAQAWSPQSRTLTGNVVLQGGTRYTHVGVQNLAWHADQINWMRAQWAGQPAPTFHIKAFGAECTNQWQARADYYIGSSFPNPLPQNLTRNNCANYEIRVRIDENRLVAGRQEWVQVKYWDERFRSQAKVVVDTYWINLNGQENYHQHYCITHLSDTPQGRAGC